MIEQYLGEENLAQEIKEAKLIKKIIQVIKKSSFILLNGDHESSIAQKTSMIVRQESKRYFLFKRILI